MKYLTRTPTRKKTPQSQPIPGREKEMTKNNAGGYAFKADGFEILRRFLILGTEGGTYYVSEKDLTKQNVENIWACLAQDAQATIKTIVDISEAGRAPKNDPALYALAAAASFPDEKVRAQALDVLPRVARIGTDLFTFAAFIDTMRGWGPALRKTVADWYLGKPTDKLAYQMVKYQQRNGWSHKDLLKLAHINGKNSALFRWALGYDLGAREVPWGFKEGARSFRPIEEPLPTGIQAFEEAKTASTKRVIELILEHGLTREMIPTEQLNSKEVWESLLIRMPLTAMIRNLGKMSSIGLLAPLSDASKTVVKRLGDQEYLHKSRVHPIKVLSALLTYSQGHGTKGSLTWTVVPQVKDALDSAFYAAFSNVEPTGKNYCLGVDVSGSMSCGVVAGVEGLTPCMGAAAMAMLVVRTEENYFIGGFAHIYKDLGITAKDTLHAAMRKAQIANFGGTDATIPIRHALQNKMPVDCFVTISDGESWAGDMHTVQALDQYRQKLGRDTKLAAINMVANRTSLTGMTDKNQVNIVGFDASVPTLLGEFMGVGKATVTVDGSEE